MKGLGPAALVARWSAMELLWSGRTLAMAALAALPLALAFAYRAAFALSMTSIEGAGAFASLVTGVYFPFVAPMLSLSYASGVVRDDVEAGTLPYYLTRPVSRSSFLLGKMSATYLVTSWLVLPSLAAAWLAAISPAGTSLESLARSLAAAALGLFAYNGLFALAGTVLKRPLLAGLVFVFGFQAAATFVPGRARLLTVAHYMSALGPHTSFASGEEPHWLLSALALAGIAVVAHGLAIAAFSRREVR
jgi:ABC-type transport system involved in multi-copper enzyme maturation permease subunit